MLYVRPPVAAGKFYDLDEIRLKKQIETSFKKAGKSRKRIDNPITAIVPHAGYIYSGHVAASVYSKLSKDNHPNFIILGTNHYMMGSKYAIMKNGLWKTPLGSVTVDEEMANSIDNSCDILETDVVAHQNEHSIEVQLPIMQYMFGSDFKFVPITIGVDTIDSEITDNFRTIGTAIANVIKKAKDKWIVIASSDFSHYVPKKRAEEVDKYVISPILKLKEDSFVQRVVEKNASVCGVGAIATAIVCAKKLGATKGKLMKYATSADTTGDKSGVVGYAGIIM